MLTAVLVLSSILAGAPYGGRVGTKGGTVAGVLRHKGCATAPAPGATVSVIGRDTTAKVETDGHFALGLPPGVYSLVVGGPGLVADQRVDDVMVTAGQTRDLGTVEVWPEERPAACGAGVPPPPAPTAIVATAPDAPALDLPGAAAAPATFQPEQIWVRGSGGTGKGQFGLQGNPAREDEDALGPPSFAVGPSGALWVLDALNARVQRFDARGHLVGTFAVAQHGDEPVIEADIAVSDEGHVFLFTAGDPPLLTEHDISGRLLVGGALSPSFKGVDLLFTGRQRPVFLMQNGQAVRAELGWGGVRAEGPLPGFPTGNLFVQADRVDRWRAAVKLLTADGRVRRSVQLHSRVPITAVRLVGVDRRGEIVLAVDRAEGSDETAQRAEVLLFAIDQLGHLSAAISVPPGGRRFEFREFALAADGVVVQMQSDTAEVRFVRWTLRAQPRDGTAGEGLVRGRIADTPRSASYVLVTIPKLRRSVPVASDGTFEVRVPAGTWTLSIRRGAAPGAPEPSPVDLKVAVAPGATVDLGAVVAVPRPPKSNPPAVAPTPGSGGSQPAAAPPASPPPPAPETPTGPAAGGPTGTTTGGPTGTTTGGPAGPTTGGPGEPTERMTPVGKP